MKKVLVALMLVSLLSISVQAANITMTASDSNGAITSFNGDVNHWSDSLAPSAGNDYFTGNFILRTPNDGGSYAFAGDSLTINNNSAYPNGLLYKGTGAAGTITVSNLILDRGMVSHANSYTDVFNLAGNINVVSDSSIYAKQGPINVYSVISGSGKITNTGSDGAGRTLTLYSAASTYTGSIVNNGRFVLADDAVLNFVIGVSGVNNSVSGTGAETVFNGDFYFNLSGAGANVGDSWIVASAAAQTFGDTFTVAGFTDMGGNLWTKAANGVIYEFSESTGTLTALIPEPASMLLLGLGGLLLRKKRS